MKVTTILILLTLVPSLIATRIGPFKCAGEKVFSFCIHFKELRLCREAVCPAGFKCQDDNNSYPCVPKPEGEPDTPPMTCTKKGKFPAPICTQFYECRKSWSYFELKLQNCPDGKAFDGKDCVLIEETTCGKTIAPTTTTTTTTIAPTTVTTAKPVKPLTKCVNVGLYPAPICTQYYECTKMLWWLNLELKNCSQGSAFNGKACVPIEETTCTVN